MPFIFWYFFEFFVYLSKFSLDVGFSLLIPLKKHLISDFSLTTLCRYFSHSAWSASTAGLSYQFWFPLLSYFNFFVSTSFCLCMLNQNNLLNCTDFSLCQYSVFLHYVLFSGNIQACHFPIVHSFHQDSRPSPMIKL